MHEGTKYDYVGRKRERWKVMRVGVVAQNVTEGEGWQIEQNMQ